MRWLVAHRLAAGAFVIGLLVGIVSFHLETRRAEQTALALASSAARHFASPAMQALAPSAPEHQGLVRLLEGSKFIGIRVFDRNAKQVFETWNTAVDDNTAAILPLPRRWPSVGESHQAWFEVEQGRFIQIVLSLTGADGNSVGYLEGGYRLGPEDLIHLREQVINGVLTATVSALVTAVLLYPLLVAMLGRATNLSARLENANLSLVHVLGRSIAKRDSDTDVHNYRVTLYAAALAEEMRLHPDTMPHLVIGAFLHDVGKIGIPDHILQKPARLSFAEYEVMKTHTILGGEIIAGIPWLEGAAQVIRHHHERYDGTGYPDGLAGDEIPISARVFAVADVFDALTSIRPYKGAISLVEAMAIVEKEAGRHFDLEVVIAFKRVVGPMYEHVAQASEAELQRAMHPLFLRCFNRDTGISQLA